MGLAELELLVVAYQRDHDLREDLDALPLDVDGCLDDGSDLHPQDLRIDDRKTASAETEHRVELMQCSCLLCNLLLGDSKSLGHLMPCSGVVRKELVERRIQKSDVSRKTVELGEHRLEVLSLHRKELSKG